MVGYEVIDLLRDFFFNVFGNPYIVTSVVLGSMIILLMIFRAPLGVVLMVMLPIISGLVLNTALSNLFDIPVWILIAVFILMGFIFSAFFLFFIK